MTPRQNDFALDTLGRRKRPRMEFEPSMVELTVDGCWRWLRSLDAAGYARIGPRYMHREVYEMFRDPIPDGLHIDHLCRNRACVNPWHLEAVPQGENTRRGWAARDHSRCKRGHDIDDPANQYAHGSGRQCRACALLRAKERARARTTV